MDRFFDDLLPADLQVGEGALHGTTDFAEPMNKNTRRRFAKGRTCPLCALRGIQHPIKNEARYCIKHSQMMGKRIKAFRQHEREYLQALGLDVPEWLQRASALHPNCRAGGALEGQRITRVCTMVQELEGQMTHGIQTYPIPYCPECGAQMVLRKPKPHQDWDPFWGCSRYKDGCRGTRNIGEDGLPEDDFDDPTSDVLHEW